jgi:hypothetical protein
MAEQPDGHIRRVVLSCGGQRNLLCASADLVDTWLPSLTTWKASSTAGPSGKNPVVDGVREAAETGPERLALRVGQNPSGCAFSQAL